MSNRTALGFGLAVVLTASGLSAQTRTGSISGTVRDATAQVLPGVSITLQGATLVTSQVTTSSEAGLYRFINLPPGEYDVRAELSGFQSLTLQTIRVDIGRNTPVDISMQIATVAETVTVIGESPLVDVKSTVTGASFDEQLLAEVPSARDVWSVLEHQAPGVTTNRLDVGGSETGLQAIFSARGTSWQQNSYYLNGVNVTCPAALGASGYYYDFDSFEEVQVATGSHPASVNAPGVFLNMVTKTGGNDFHGGGTFYYQNDSTQGDNLTDELRARGASRGGFDYLSDANAQLGGPILKDRSTFYFSWRDERVHRFVSGFPEVESTDMWQFLIKNNTQINDRNRVGVEWHHMSYYKPNRDAAGNRAPEATWIEDDTFDIVQAEWNSTLSDTALLDVRFSHLKVFFPTFLQPDGTRQAAFDAGTNFFFNAHDLEVERDRRRYTVKGDLTYFRERWLNANHEFKFGVELDWNPVENVTRANDNVEIRFRNGAADEVRLRNTPLISKEAVNQFAFFVDDVVNVGRRLTLKLGLRYDAYEGYLPEQNSPVGTWVPERSFPERRNILDVGSFAPRLGIVLGLEENGRSALKASFGRYYHQFPTGVPNFANQNASLFDTYDWTDLNGDNLFQNGEQGVILSRGIAAQNLVDPDFIHPHTDEITGSLEKEFARNLFASATYSHRWGRNLNDSVDIGIPFSAYSPVNATDPGPDGRLGTSDDGAVFTVYNLDPAFRGKNQRMFTNPEGFKLDSDTVELVLQKRFSDNWQGLVSYTWMDAETTTRGAAGDGDGANGFYDNPNNLINAEGAKPFWHRPHQFKVAASYQLPMEFRISGVIRTQSGAPYARTFTVAGLNQGTVTILSEKNGDSRLESVATADITIGKNFRVGDTSIAPEFALFNIFNANDVFSINTASGTNFNRVLGFLAPRIFRVGVRVNF
ncbi:MAG TPA: TonB-dependent receptor [Vicinamibacteria bacterium]|nr:TonB-dependent receptor [Vicinamibacteria bacterium]